MPRFYHTPSHFLHIMRRVADDPDFVEIVPTSANRWNDWLFRTKRGNPYYVVSCRGVLASIGRWRKTRHEKWKYRVFWPYLASPQQVFVSESPDEVLRWIKSQIKNAA